MTMYLKSISENVSEMGNLTLIMMKYIRQIQIRGIFDIKTDL